MMTKQSTEGFLQGPSHGVLYTVNCKYRNINYCATCTTPPTITIRVKDKWPFVRLSVTWACSAFWVKQDQS
uniref:Uncharacterized protein n=1 Tax=Anguilla anguilla TaxID=7936 RepID=A0A0E9V5A5_ANGAN